LKQRSSIQKFIAFLLLLVFAVSTAPKAYFHDLLANHKDVAFCHHPPTTSDCVHKQGYNCHFDDLVVSAPFLSLTEQPVVLINFYFEKKQPAFYYSFPQSFLQHKENRGPPTI